MAQDFELTVLTPGKTIYSGKTTEVVLPAYDGEVGVLASHGNFIGKLGTGLLKVVKDGDDYWFMLSHGFYQVEDGKLTVLTEKATTSNSIDIEACKTRYNELDQQLKNLNVFARPDFPKIKQEHLELKAILEVYKKTNLLN